MKQVLQNMKSGAVRIEELPPPVLRDQGVLVRTAASLVSAGTERMLMKLAKKGLLGKARERPDLVQKVLAKLRRDGFLATFQAVREKLDREIPLGYSVCGQVTAVGSKAQEFSVGQRVACAIAWHAPFNRGGSRANWPGSAAGYRMKEQSRIARYFPTIAKRHRASSGDWR